MCVIIDVNIAHQVVNHNPDMQPILDWLFSNPTGKIVIGGKLSDELSKNEKFNLILAQLERAGRVRIMATEQVATEIANMHRQGLNCISNDIHIIALGRLSGARILCSIDQALHTDFTNPDLIHTPRGHIYQKQKHRHLLRRYGHTTACGQGVR